MRKTLSIILLVVVFFVWLWGFSGCTEQQRAKKFGGTAKIELKSGEKLVVLTWKDSDLWILTRPMRTSELAEVYEFSESSSYGIIQGKIIIVEKTR
jgi:hypothetical protein